MVRKATRRFCASRQRLTLRRIIPTKPEKVEAWLNPDPGNLAAAYAILDDRARPFYEYRMVALLAPWIRKNVRQVARMRFMRVSIAPQGRPPCPCLPKLPSGLIACHMPL